MIGVLSALPIVNALNLCCCLWVVTGGVVAAYLLQQNDPMPITTGDGAAVGLMAGVIGAFVNLLLSIPIAILLAPMQQAFFERMADSGMPPELREMVTAGIGSAMMIVVGFILMLIAGVVFSTLGGVLGAAIFRRPPNPAGAPPVIDVPPPPM